MFEESYDDILAARLLCYACLTTLSGEPVDTSKGSLIYIKESVAAAVEWGQKKYLQKVFKSRLPTTPDGETPAAWADIFGVPVDPADTENDIIMNFLTKVRHPAAGGNKYDWPNWAMPCTYLHDPGVSEWTEKVSSVKIFPCPRGPGSLDVVVTSKNVSTGAEVVPSAELLAVVTEAIEEVAPVPSNGTFLVIAAVSVPKNVSITTYGLPLSKKPSLIADLTAFMNSAQIGTAVPFVQLASICVEHGAERIDSFADIAAAAGPDTYEVIRAGTITVSP